MCFLNVFNQRRMQSLQGRKVSAHQSVAVSGSTDVLERRPRRRNWVETSTGLCHGAPALYPARYIAEKVRTLLHCLFHCHRKDHTQIN